MKHAIVNLGCKVNRVEADAFERLLQAAGSLPSEEAEADLIIVNTCTVTGDAEKKTRKAVRRALRENAGASVTVTGCAAVIDPDTFTEMSERVSVVPKHEMESFLGRMLAEGSESDAPRGSLVLPRRRLGVKVQDGCDNACTYCIVHVARGPARSCDEEAIVADALSLAETGIREIVLTGINLGAYGREGEGRSIAKLLERLLRETERFVDGEGRPCRFRLSSIEPTDVDDALLDTIAAAEGRICRHLHLPLQAGSTKVLEEMARPYTAEAYGRLIEKVRARVPRIALSTDVIVGFPGETEEDFARTMRLSEACGFSSMHVFPYSRREGTPAAVRIDQVDPVTKAERAARLRRLARGLREADARARAGTTELVVAETPDRGVAESYHEVTLPVPVRPGSFASYVFPEASEAS